MRRKLPGLKSNTEAVDYRNIMVEERCVKEEDELKGKLDITQVRMLA